MPSIRTNFAAICAEWRITASKRQQLLLQISYTAPPSEAEMLYCYYSKQQHTKLLRLRAKHHTCTASKPSPISSMYLNP